jgi:TalC/MipB family fructose-6-phosphate aldolase
MEFLLDSADIKEIGICIDRFPITGVTTNPSILKLEGKVDFFPHLRAIRELIGPERSLHVQVIASGWEGMVREGEIIREKIDEGVFIKVPLTEEGLKAMGILQKKGAGITATAVYSKIQGFLALARGASFIAPYYNRMESAGIDPRDLIRSLREQIGPSPVKILAASFKNITQAVNALSAGAHAVTLPPGLLHEALRIPAVEKALADFDADWRAFHPPISS